MTFWKTLCATGVALAVTAAAPAGAVTSRYVATLDGPSESPPNASPGTGTATLRLDAAAMTYSLEVDFSGLLGTVTASHIHGPTAVAGLGTAGVMTTTPTFPGFPSGVTSGSYAQTFDLTQSASFNPAFVTAQGGLSSAAAVFMLALGDGRAYLNIHSSQFSGGEIRGFFTYSPVPLPASGLLILAPVAAAAWASRRRRRDAAGAVTG